MPAPRWPRRVASGRRRILLGAHLALGVARRASTDPIEWLPVESPAYEELDLLRTEGLLDTTFSLDTRPIARADLARLVAFARSHHPDRADHPGIVRLSREFSRELARLGFDPIPRSTSPLLRYPSHADSSDRGRLTVIPYLDAAFERRPDGRGRLADHSRAGLRIGIELGDVLLYQDLFAGRIDGGHGFADPLVQDTDFIHYTEDTYVSARTRWVDLSFGRMRHGWGPGRDGSLVWSETAAPVTHLLWAASLFGGRVRGTAVHADVDAARGARLAGHRVDLDPTPALHFGVSEAVRYHSDHWEPLYVVSVIPFTLVQRMLAQDQVGDSLLDIRNNVMISFDTRWRVLPGTTLYGELLFDDLTFKKSGTPVRLGYQAGWLGSGSALHRRLSWRAELSRVYRYVYSVFYDENFIHQSRPIGFPEGPDSRRLLVQGAMDLSPDWNLSLSATHLDWGQGGLGEFFDPAGPPARGSVFGGIVETTRSLSAGANWTPRDGVSAGLRWGYEWREDADHVSGQDTEGWFGRAELFLRH
jgi:hypothetical protein